MILSRRSFTLTALGGAAALFAGRLRGQDFRSFASDKILQPKRSASRPGPPVITCLAIQPGGSLVAVGGDDHLLRIWNARTGELRYELAGHRDWIRAMAFLPAGDKLITSGNDRRLLLWTIADGGVVHTEIARHDQAVFSMALHPAGRELAAVGFESHLCRYQLPAVKHLEHEECPCADMRCVIYSPAGTLLAAAGRGGKIRIWRTSDMSVAKDIDGHRRRVRAIAFSPDGAALATAGEDGATRVWSTANGTLTRELPSPEAKVMAVVFVDAQRLVTAGTDNVVRIWNLPSGREEAALKGHTGTVTTLALADGLLASGGYDATVRLWRLTPAASEESTLPDWRLGTSPLRPQQR